MVEMFVGMELLKPRLVASKEEKAPVSYRSIDEIDAIVVRA